MVMGVSSRTMENEISSKEVAEDGKYFKVCFLKVSPPHSYVKEKII